MDRRRRGHQVEIREFVQGGLDEDSITFTSFKMLDDFLHSGYQYSNSIERQSKTNQITNRFILHSFDEPKRYYIIWKVDGEIMPTNSDIRRFSVGNFYKKRKSSVKPIPKMSRKELNEALERKKRRSALLIAIDEKYGGIENAEGTWELKELRDMIGAIKGGEK